MCKRIGGMLFGTVMLMTQAVAECIPVDDDIYWSVDEKPGVVDLVLDRDGEAYSIAIVDKGVVEESGQWRCLASGRIEVQLESALLHASLFKTDTGHSILRFDETSQALYSERIFHLASY